MASVIRKGSTIHTSGDLPDVGDLAPEFRLTDGEFKDRNLESFGRRKKILNIVPSLDTGVCSASAKTFDARAGELPDTEIITISRDLPYALRRFRETERVGNITLLSAFRDHEFGTRYGIGITDGPTAGLLARSVVVLDADNRVVYTQLVREQGNEPDYDAAIEAARRAP